MSKKNKIVIIVAVLVVIAFAFILFKPKKKVNADYNSILKNLMGNQSNAPKISDFLPKSNSENTTKDIDHKVVKSTMASGQNIDDFIRKEYPLISKYGYKIKQ